MGGTISWQFISSNLTDNGTVTIKLKQTYSWVNTAAPCLLVTGRAVDSLVCVIGCNSNIKNISTLGTCINYDFALNITTSQSIQSVTYPLGAQLVMAYRNINLMQLVSGPKAWSLITYINLVVRNDSGQINSSPTTNMPPLITVRVNTQQRLRIPMVDIDYDIVKCRWSNGTAVILSTSNDECGGICQDLPGAKLYSSANLINNCTIVFNTSTVGHYALAIQIEDFMPSAPNGTALSSIPLQFIIRSITSSCNIPIIMAEYLNDATIYLKANVTYSTDIYAQTDCNDTNIASILAIILPLGMSSISSMVNYNLQRASTTFTWIPTVDQVGTKHLFCTIAMDSKNLQSAEFCLNFVVLPPETTTVLVTKTNQESTNLYLLLGLCLGICLPCCLVLNILSFSCLPRWLHKTFLGKLRRRFLHEDEEQLSPQLDTESNNPITNKRRGLYHEQYINLEESSYVPEQSSSSNINRVHVKSSEFELESWTETTTRFLSPTIDRMTPIDRPSNLSPLPTTILPNQNPGSILVRDYFKQNNH